MISVRPQHLAATNRKTDMKHQWHYERQERNMNKRAEAAMGVLLAVAIGLGLATLLFVHLSK